jgi:predicted nucleotidyltransferase component of viral defense system
MELRQLRFLALKNGLSLNYISKDERLSMLLSQLREIFENDVVLKGGTALNRIYLSKLGVSRFSEDIDLDYLRKDKLDDKIKDIKKHMKDVTKFNVKGPRLLHRTLRFDCYYENELGTRDRIMVEFYLTKNPYSKRDQMVVKSPFVETHPTIFSVYSKEDLLARKIIALYNRMEGKDIYDVFYGIRIEYDRNRLDSTIEVLLPFYKIADDLFPSLLKNLNSSKKRAKYIGNTTNHFIPKKLRFNWEEIIRTLYNDLERDFL